MKRYGSTSVYSCARLLLTSTSINLQRIAVAFLLDEMEKIVLATTSRVVTGRGYGDFLIIQILRLLRLISRAILGCTFAVSRIGEANKYLLYMGEARLERENARRKQL